MDCDCRIDWVCCFWRQCPRAARLRQQQQEQYRRAQEFMGPPSEGVYIIPIEEWFGEQ